MNLKSPTEKQSRIIWFALTGLAVATVIALIVTAVWGLGRVLDLLSPVLWPLAIAGVVACLLSPVVDFFERKKIPRARAIILVFVMAFALVLAVLTSVIPQIVVETEQLASKVPNTPNACKLAPANCSRSRRNFSNAFCRKRHRARTWKRTPPAAREIPRSLRRLNG